MDKETATLLAASIKRDVELKEEMKATFESWLPETFTMSKYDDFTWHVKKGDKKVLSVGFLGINWSSNTEACQIWIKKIYGAPLMKILKLDIGEAETSIKGLFEFLNGPITVG